MPRGQRPSRRILSVEFETEVQHSGPQFSLPKEIARFLGVDSNDQLYISIQGAASMKKEVKELVSGVEIRDNRLKPGTIIRVTASLLSPKPIT
jgi:hypothetical protein